MKNYLLPQNGSFFKANMHCHSTLSDGKLTVEQIKELYKNAGYSIVAFTDHNVLIDHSDLADDGFMPITGYEYDVFDERATAHIIIRRSYTSAFTQRISTMTYCPAIMQIRFLPVTPILGKSRNIPAHRTMSAATKT